MVVGVVVVGVMVDLHKDPVDLVVEEVLVQEEQQVLVVGVVVEEVLVRQEVRVLLYYQYQHQIIRQTPQVLLRL
jgi:hypothetical protein